MPLGVLVMTGQLEKLAREHYVHVHTTEDPSDVIYLFLHSFTLTVQDPAPTVEEVVEAMRERLRPIPKYISSRDRALDRGKRGEGSSSTASTD
jgi:hypothetical protein